MPSLLVDSASIYYRAYHALPETITAPDGTPVNAVRGFIDTIAAMLGSRDEMMPIACWDDDWRPQWRVDLVPSYKTHRLADDAAEPGATPADGAAEEVPDTLAPQVDILRELLPRIGVPIVGAPAAEADDVIADLSAEEPDATAIASGDRDLVQLVSDRVTLLYTGGSSASRGGRPWVEMTPIVAQERFGVAPHLYADLAILRGDPSDGLPGARGIGEKTAVALIRAFGGLDSILSAAGDDATGPPLTPAVRRRLIDAHEHLLAAERVVRLTPLPGRSSMPASMDVDPQAALAAASAWGVQAPVRRLLDAMGR